MKTTQLRGARTHNLKNIDVDIEPGSFVVIAGPSGAGKSSLAFDTLYAEGQRRFVESFSPYARQFLERLARPAVDSLEPVPAAIAVDRQPPAKTSRSTVGTMTEITDYAKELWSRLAVLYCPSCGRKVTRDNAEAAAHFVIEHALDQKIVVTFEIHVNDAAHWMDIRDALIKEGYRRLWVHDAAQDIDAVAPSALGLHPTDDSSDDNGAPKKSRKKKEAKSELPPHTHRVNVVVDRLVARNEDRPRLIEALEAALRRTEHTASVVALSEAGHYAFRFSSELHCAYCDIDYRDATPGLFSFNNPVGACETCRGFGRVIGIDWDRVIPDKRKTLETDAVKAWAGASAEWERRELKKQAGIFGIPMDKPLESFTDAQWQWLIEGDGKTTAQNWSSKGWPGVKGWFDWLETKAYKMHVRIFLSRYRKYEECPVCLGKRFKPEALNWKIDSRSISDFNGMPISEALSFIEKVQSEEAHNPAVKTLLEQCAGRLALLVNVGLSYLTLDRTSRTLSGGESQRVALTSALGASLSGAMFVMDEPTSGLHPKDIEQLITVVRRITDGGNTGIVVEHDLGLMAEADRVIELGPNSGEAGGEIVFDGPPSALKSAATATAKAINSKLPRLRRRVAKGWLSVEHATGHNLKNANLKIPVGCMTAVVGVSGSGKSSLVLETLMPAVARAVGQSMDVALPHGKLSGEKLVQWVVHVDQAPMGRTSRGNPATYLKVWDIVRRRFASEKLSKERGYGPGYFSFNVPGGRCEVCKGEGSETIEMQFLADVTFECPVCKGARFADAALEVRHRNHTVSDYLRMTASEILAVLSDDKDLKARLQPLVDVGLGYVRMGQPLSTLSGGEAQRLKLSLALGRATTGSLVVLDEPTSGLHDADIEPLMKVLQRMVDRGDTVVLVEHDMRVAAQCDHIVELGPGAGEAGGQIVAEGSPESVAASTANSAPYLSAILKPVAESQGKLKASVKQRGTNKVDHIDVVGANEHNLQNVEVHIPHGQLTVVTGPSGSGKSTLAFDVIFAEAQRRYLETLSPYARQYLPQLPKPSVESVSGLPPAVSLEQRITRGGANSTVATVTEVSHFLRLLFAKVGVLRCPKDGALITSQSPEAVVESIVAKFGQRTHIEILAPILRAKKGAHRELLLKLKKQGFTLARIDGKHQPLANIKTLSRFNEHDIDVVVDALSTSDSRLTEVTRKALSLGRGTVVAMAAQQTLMLSTQRTCPECGTGYPELDPRFFSFNTPQGACEQCGGKGFTLEVIGKGANAREVEVQCEACQGTRLSPLARSVTIGERPITDFLSLGVARAREELRTLQLEGRDAEVAKAPLQELEKRLAFLERVGLDYLGLDRRANTLSGGETQRVRLAAQLGAGLTGLLYVLDEPTIGLHPRDTHKLIDAMRLLVDQGCSLLVVEHDMDTIRSADHIIDMGPAGGRLGGAVVAEGAPAQLSKRDDSSTGQALKRTSGFWTRPSQQSFESPSTQWLEVKGARQNNLKNVDLKIPLGQLVAVTGVSGSGKSTLIQKVLLPSVRHALDLVAPPAGAHDSLAGTEFLKRAIQVDQSPIGRTPRSVPATYMGVWDEIRRLLANVPEARARGYKPNRFSFNTGDGRCPVCEGQGAISVEMTFLPEVSVVCEGCGGKRFNQETLSILYKDLDVGQILCLDMSAAADVFSPFPKIARPLKLLDALGLGYLTLGQASNTLSGGEAQRLKLVTELANPGQGRTLYVLDEPTTGLHRNDVFKLIHVLKELVERGDTVVVIEHHTDVMLASDWIIDLGPESGDGGGQIIAQGRPQDIVQVELSHTARILRDELKRKEAA